MTEFDKMMRSALEPGSQRSWSPTIENAIVAFEQLRNALQATAEKDEAFIVQVNVDSGPYRLVSALGSPELALSAISEALRYLRPSLIANPDGMLLRIDVWGAGRRP